MNKIIRSAIIFTLDGINQLLFPSYDIKKCPHNKFLILKCGLVQKVLFINRNVPWPVHYTSKVKSIENIVRGSRTPGLALNCYIDGRNGIIIEENVWIGPRVSIISMNHSVANYNEYMDDKPIKIGKNSWIAANAVILPGVELGEHTIVSSGAVVTHSFVDGNIMLAGVPAKIVKKIEKYVG